MMRIPARNIGTFVWILHYKSFKYMNSGQAYIIRDGLDSTNSQGNFIISARTTEVTDGSYGSPNLKQQQKKQQNKDKTV